MSDDFSCSDRVNAVKCHERLSHEAQSPYDRSLVQAVMNGAKNAHLALLDRDFNYICVNETYAANSGCSPEEMIGKHHFELYPDAENELVFTRVRDTGETFEDHAAPFKFPNQAKGGLTWWDLTLSPVKDHAGEMTGLVLSLFDTTSRIRAEQQVRDMNNALEQQVQQRTLEFQQTFHDLQIHQIELEIQNDELRRMQVRLDATQGRYFDLYDLAPVSFSPSASTGLFLRPTSRRQPCWALREASCSPSRSPGISAKKIRIFTI